MPLRRTAIRRIVSALLLGAPLAACVDTEGLPLGTIVTDVVDDPGGAPASYHGDFTTMSVMQLSADSVEWTSVGVRIEPTGSIAPTAPPAGAPLLSTAMPDAPVLAEIGLQDENEAVRITFGSFVRAGTFRFARLILMPKITGAQGQRVASPVAHARVTGTVGGVDYLVGPTRFAQSLELVIDRRIEPVTLGRDERVTFTWDLNTERWITPTAMTTQRLDREAVAAAVEVSWRR